MCGIVGYAGTKIAKPLLLEGLERMEYRGYDSAGLALYSPGQKGFTVRRSLGVVKNLVEHTRDIGLTEHQGIAHTRWATHGIPSEVNAHPHRAGLTVLVHNGIIENHAELKTELLKEGAEFSSQTDTEVFTHLIESERRRLTAQTGQAFEALTETEKRKVVLNALQSSMKRVHGHYAILFLVAGLDEYLFGAQHGAPLIIGHAGDGALVASDLQAILPLTKEVSFLPMNSFFSFTPKALDIFDAQRVEVLRIPRETINWSAEKVAKEGFDHYMLKEIHEQPLVVADTLSGRIPEQVDAPFVWDNPKAHEALWKNVRKLNLVACGSAYYSAMIAKYYFERWAKLPVEVDLASEFRYRHPILEPGTVMGVISQSGETADTLAALRLANERGATTFSVCNVPGSTIMRESQFQYSTKAGPEIGVASTKAFTAQLTVLCALAQDVARMRGTVDREARSDAFDSLARLPYDMEKILLNADRYRAVGASLKNQKVILCLGRGSMYPVALEGALKLKEITYRHAEGYAAGELKHGPIALVDEQLTAIVLSPNDELKAKTLSNLEEIRSRKGKIIGIGDESASDFAKLCDEYIPLPKTSWATAPMLYTVPLQLIAYGLALALECNIDKPRNLAKSVTVE